MPFVMDGGRLKFELDFSKGWVAAFADMAYQADRYPWPDDIAYGLFGPATAEELPDVPQS